MDMYLSVAIIVFMCQGIPVHSKFRCKIYQNGRFDLVINGITWLRSGETWFQADNGLYTTADNSLSLQKVTAGKGVDNLGRFQFQKFEYKGNKNIFQTVILTYPSIPNVVQFGQVYVNDTIGTSLGSKFRVISGFPSLRIEEEEQLAYFSPRGYFTGEAQTVYSRWNKEYVDLKDEYKMGPIAFFKSGVSDALVFSHSSNFMAASYWYNSSASQFNVGLQGRVESVPQGQEMWSIVQYSGEGINQAFREWGGTLQKLYKAQNFAYGSTDLTANYLGYWTDNGAYYYYYTETNKTYEATFIDLWKYAENQRIPYRYIQYDSWFYPQDPQDHGMLQWFPLTSAFPNTTNYIQKITGWHAAAHQRYWSHNTPLAKQNGGIYDFHLEQKYALPLDAKLWKDILENSTLWGNLNLVQDWLGQMYENLDILQKSLTAGQTYMSHMSYGASINSLTIELCTAYPRHSLTALTMPPVTYERVSGDYQPGNDQWKIGHTAMWISALGQLPFKDNFWTTSHQTSPKYPGLREHWPRLQSLVASLSAGPVAIGDSVMQSNKDLILRCCNDEGLILKPSRPATTVDAIFYERALKPGSTHLHEVWTTHCTVGSFFFGVVFGADFRDELPFVLTPRSAGFNKQMDNTFGYKSFPYDNSLQLREFSSRSPLELVNCSKTNFCLYYISPVIRLGDEEIVLLGELSKWIPFSPKRIETIRVLSDIHIYLKGAVGEQILFSVLRKSSVQVLTCRIPQQGIAVLSVMQGSCR